MILAFLFLSVQSRQGLSSLHLQWVSMVVSSIDLRVVCTLYYCMAKTLAGIIFGGLLSKHCKQKLVDLNLVVSEANNC